MPVSFDDGRIKVSHMIIWTGNGVLGFIAMLATFTLPVVGSVLMMESYPNNPPWINGIGIALAPFLSGTVGWVLGRRWNRGATKPEELHTIYFVRVEYWGAMILLFACVVATMVVYGVVQERFLA